MDDLVATKPVALLPQGISSVEQRLADVVITNLDSKAEAELAFHFKQPTALGKLIAVLCVGASITAASLGVVTKVLAELNDLKRVEGKIALGVVVLHDILGVLILAAVSELTSSTRLDALYKFQKMLLSKH